DDTKVGFTDEGFEAPASYPGYTLAWQEEFSGTAINENVWSFETGNGCPNNCGFGNNELQTYTRDNAYLQDGKLIIEAKREGTGYTSTRMISRDKKTFKFGRIDIRARLPKGKGIWPALWMMPQASKFGTWPASGEIDIMELVGHEPSKVHGTVHYGPAWPNNLNKGGSFSLPAGTFSDAFHVFSIEWQADVIRWYVDNQLFFTLNKADLGNHNYPFNEDFFFIINLAVGGNWPGSPDAQTYFPQFLIVDYLRVYQ
ncbi:MAG TPA: glycoside hydrolase family 16 protein, partial [Chitinophagaceae bacterium]|nr:glycoside hydrolase family 16 protein [Chitinophagaceae bacterium]